MLTRTLLVLASLGLLLTSAVLLSCESEPKSKDAALESDEAGEKRGGAVEASAERGASDDPHGQVAAGRRVFRFETFDNEVFWSGTAKMHEVIAKSISPAKALEVGLKVDAEAIPADVANGIRSGKVDLKSPETTVALLKLDAVVGLKGTIQNVGGRDTLISVGITCALCHSTVDDSFSPGIGKRRDGWPNRDLNVGAIIALSPAITAEQKSVYNSWGPGKYDPRYNLDRKNTPLVIPPAYGLATIKNETYSADGSMSYWNAYVAVTQMHGKGTFSDRRLGIDVKSTPDLVTPLLPALREYQHSLATPTPPKGFVEAAAMKRGRAVFEANCQKCHVGGSGTDNNNDILHDASETGMDSAYAERTATKKYRTTPLRGLSHHAPYFHDGRAKTLVDVVDHYRTALKIDLTPEERRDLVEFLKSL